MKSFIKLVFATLIVCAGIFANTANAQNYTGAWCIGDCDGRGSFFEHAEKEGVIFGAPFFYDANNQATFITFGGGLSKDAQFRDTITTSANRSSGPQMMNYDANKGQIRLGINVGTITIVFHSPSSATMTYSFLDNANNSLQTGSVNMFRLNVTSNLHYADKVYALWDGAYPYVVTKSGVTRVANKTHYPGLAPFFNCWLAEKQLSDGKILISCQESQSLVRSVFYIDPIKEEIHDYTGVVPTNIIWHDVPWGTDTTYANLGLNIGPLGSYAKVQGGLFYRPGQSVGTMMYRDDATGGLSTVKAGAFADGSIGVLISYTN